MSDIEYEWRYRVANRTHMRELLTRAKELGGLPAVKYLLVNHSFAGKEDGQSGRVRVALNTATGEQEVTMTVKRSKHKVPGAGTKASDFEEELEVVVSDAGTAISMLETLGLTLKYTMEKFRTVVKVPAMCGELDFDEAPGLPAYLEVECQTLRDLKALSGALGLPPKGERFSILNLYQELYGKAPEKRLVGDLTFRRPSNLKSLVKRDKATFSRILNDQRAQQRKVISLHKNLSKDTQRMCRKH